MNYIVKGFEEVFLVIGCEIYFKFGIVVMYKVFFLYNVVNIGNCDVIVYEVEFFIVSVLVCESDFVYLY